MRLLGLHILLTYQCDRECDHCFVWGSPHQTGAMTLDTVRDVLRQAADVDSIEWVYFEGGEPFLRYSLLLEAVREARSLGFRVGIVSNGFWATDPERALERLAPFAGLLEDLTISTDSYHCPKGLCVEPGLATKAANKLGIVSGTISIDAAKDCVMYRGRAAERLAANARGRPWSDFTECPYEELADPTRLHVDPLGNLHVCQGICLGNIFRAPLEEICEAHRPASCPIAGPLIEGGPAELVRRYGLPHDVRYADACHLCYQARLLLRDRFPEVLAPDQVYGVRPRRSAATTEP